MKYKNLNLIRKLSKWSQWTASAQGQKSGESRLLKLCIQSRRKQVYLCQSYFLSLVKQLQCVRPSMVLSLWKHKGRETVWRSLHWVEFTSLCGWFCQKVGIYISTFLNVEFLIQAWEFFICFIFLRQYLTSGPDWPGTCYAVQTGLVSASQVLEL